MRRKNPQTVRGWARKYKRMHARYDEFKARADAFEERLIRARKEIAALVAQRDQAENAAGDLDTRGAKTEKGAAKKAAGATKAKKKAR